MMWEHLFIFAQDKMVLRAEPVAGRSVTNGPKLPMSIPQYVSELGATEGYEFAGAYPNDDGVMIVMKRQRDPDV